MKKSLFTLFSVLCGFIGSLSAQNLPADTFTLLVAREWKLAAYGDNNKKELPSGQQLQSRVTFFKDFRVLSTEDGRQEYGRWRYNRAANTITLIRQKEGSVVLEIIKLDRTQFIVGYKDPAGAIIEIHMLPAGS